MLASRSDRSDKSKSALVSPRARNPARHLKIEIAALANIRKLLVLIAVLRNAPDAEANVSTVRDFLLLHKLQMQIVERGMPIVYGTRGRMRHCQAGKLSA